MVIFHKFHFSHFGLHFISLCLLKVSLCCTMLILLCLIFTAVLGIWHLVWVVLHHFWQTGIFFGVLLLMMHFHLCSILVILIHKWLILIIPLVILGFIFYFSLVSFCVFNNLLYFSVSFSLTYFPLNAIHLISMFVGPKLPSGSLFLFEVFFNPPLRFGSLTRLMLVASFPKIATLTSPWAD